jgi:hypothetical protein
MATDLLDCAGWIMEEDVILCTGLLSLLTWGTVGMAWPSFMTIWAMLGEEKDLFRPEEDEGAEDSDFSRVLVAEELGAICLAGSLAPDTFGVGSSRRGEAEEVEVDEEEEEEEAEAEAAGLFGAAAPPGPTVGGSHCVRAVLWST